MKRLTQYISNYPHGAEGVSEEQLTGSYCRGYFEATAIVERLAAIEDILGDDYSIDELRSKLEKLKGYESGEYKKIIHAHWRQTYKSGLKVPCGNAVCSNCDCFSHYRSSTCPNCSAEMDEEVKTMFGNIYDNPELVDKSDGGSD